MDKIIDQEYLNAFEDEDAKNDEKVLFQVSNMDELWSDEPLTRTPHKILDLKLII